MGLTRNEGLLDRNTPVSALKAPLILFDNRGRGVGLYLLDEGSSSLVEFVVESFPVVLDGFVVLEVQIRFTVLHFPGFEHFHDF